MMLKIDDDAELYANNGQNRRIPGNYLQIMFAEVYDASVVPLVADNGIFFSFEITDVTPKSCPVYTDAYLIYNIEGGGGTRDIPTIFTTFYENYVQILRDECDALADSAIPVNYRQISFD